MPIDEIKIGSRVKMVLAEVRKNGLRIKGVKTGTVTGMGGEVLKVRRDGMKVDAVWHGKFWELE